MLFVITGKQASGKTTRLNKIKASSKGLFFDEVQECDFEKILSKCVDKDVFIATQLSKEIIDSFFSSKCCVFYNYA